MGWFQGNSKYLHGYGMKFNTMEKQEGLFERGSFRKSKEQVMTYDGENELIAHKIML